MSKCLINTILSFLLLAGLSISEAAGQMKDCDEIKVKTTIENTSNGQNNGKILIHFEIKEKADSYRILLLGMGWEKPLEGNKEGFKNLQSGFYDIYLIDKKGCSKQLNLQVK